MREIDVSGCELIHSGQCWKHAKEPSSRDMVRFLECNESYCSWFQPVGRGVESQFPAIRMNGCYYQLSLRVQKAIFRHIRLSKVFRNLETSVNGRPKLRIPHTLLLEKRRTSMRFTVPFVLYALLLTYVLYARLYVVCVI